MESSSWIVSIFSSASFSSISSWVTENSGLAPSVSERIDRRSRFYYSRSTYVRVLFRHLVGESLRIVLGFIWVKCVPKKREALLKAEPNIFYKINF